MDSCPHVTLIPDAAPEKLVFLPDCDRFCVVSRSGPHAGRVRVLPAGDGRWRVAPISSWVWS